jgi:DNA-binding transcriptional MerR regulator/methylmalonyl-CoA mutase cobalamin-binding subunit
MYKMNGTVSAHDLNAPLYNLSAVVKKTGLKPPTIRAWERRYGIPHPQRTSGGHRQYSQRDIDMLNWLIARQEEGMSISHAVKLWRTLSNKGDNLLRKPISTSTIDADQAIFPQTSTEVKSLRDEWVDACLTFDRQFAEQVLVRAFALFSPEVVCVQLLQAGLSKIGDLWYKGQVTIQQEHFASAMSVQRLEMLIAATPPPTRSERIIVASAEDDFHVFSPLLFTFLLRRRGWDVIYLGANMPAAALEETIDQLKPHMLILSAQTLSTATSLLDITAALTSHETIIGYGGIIFNMMPQLQERIPAHYLGPTIDGAMPVVERLMRQRSSNPSVSPDQSFSKALRQFKQQRSLIEADIWRHYVANDKSTAQLDEINNELAGIVTATLIFGDNNILSRDMEWIQYLSNNYHLSETEVNEYVESYQRAAKVHLNGTGRIIADSLEKITIN